MAYLRTQLILACITQGLLAVNNGLARTPQMGWNNWNALGCDVSQELLLNTAQKLIGLGLRDLGYNYVVLDDCWSDNRGDDGFLVEDFEKFPKGMKQIGNEIHDMGLLYGMYSSAGEMTCARYPGSLDYETQDAEKFASWGVDYVKYDNCYHMGRFGTPEISFNRYQVMWKAINATGRPMLYSLCNWGEDYVHTWGMSIANSWRMSGDIYDSFTRPDALCSCDDPRNPACVAPGNHCSVLYIINKVAPYADRAQPGGWNDMDMLEVGNGGMTDDEYKAHFSMWSALKSPLLISTDLREVTSPALTILNNPAVIAINQDPLGRSAVQIRRDLNVKKDQYGMGEAQVWSGQLAGGDQVVIFLNAADEDLNMEASLAEIFYHEGPNGHAPQVKEKWAVYDLWANRMDNNVAQQILDAPTLAAANELLHGLEWYNSTEIPYKQGLADKNSRLFGKWIGTISPKGSLKSIVRRHSAEMFRLVSENGTQLKRYNNVKDEL